VLLVGERELSEWEAEVSMANGVGLKCSDFEREVGCGRCKRMKLVGV
jgi:hypothetical protein